MLTLVVAKILLIALSCSSITLIVIVGIYTYLCVRPDGTLCVMTSGFPWETPGAPWYIVPMVLTVILGIVHLILGGVLIGYLWVNVDSFILFYTGSFSVLFSFIYLFLFGRFMWLLTEID